MTDCGPLCHCGGSGLSLARLPRLAGRSEKVNEESVTSARTCQGVSPSLAQDIPGPSVRRDDNDIVIVIMQRSSLVVRDTARQLIGMMSFKILSET